MTATAPARIAEWSDGRERGRDFHGSDLQIAIANYFGERNETELRRLQVDNEKLRDEIETRKVRGATA